MNRPCHKDSYIIAINVNVQYLDLKFSSKMINFAIKVVMRCRKLCSWVALTVAQIKLHTVALMEERVDFSYANRHSQCWTATVTLRPRVKRLCHRDSNIIIVNLQYLDLK